MPSTARMTDALRGRGKALVLVGAAAALTGAGAASAAVMTAGPGQPAVASHSMALSGHNDPVSLALASQLRLNAAPAVTQHPVTNTAGSKAERPAPAARDNAARHGAPHHAAERHAPAARHAGALGPDARLADARHADGRRGEARHGSASHRGHARPYEIYDSVTPSAIPSGHEVATYADGHFAASPAQVAGKKVLWIDTNGSDPRANALDVEPGDATPAGAATWASHKLHADPHGQAIIYTMESDWSAAKSAVRATLPASLQSHVRWWIADPTGVPHVVPGSSATQWYWGTNYDITTAHPGF